MKDFLRETDDFFAQFMTRVTRRLFYWMAFGFLAFFALSALSASSTLLAAIVDRVFILTPRQAVLQGNIWQFVTYMFAHGGFLHFFFNLLALFFFGPLVEERMGGRRFFFYVMLAGISGGIVHCGIALAVGQADVGVIGFSGAIYAILTAAVIWFPRMTVYFFFFPVPLRILAAFFGVLLFFQIFASIAAEGILGGGVSHIAHVMGIVAGFLMVRHPRVLDFFEDLYIPFVTRRRPKRVRRLSMGHPGRHSDPDDRYNDPHWYLDQ